MTNEMTQAHAAFLTYKRQIDEACAYSAALAEIAAEMRRRDEAIVAYREALDFARIVVADVAGGGRRLVPQLQAQEALGRIDRVLGASHE